MHFKNSKFTLEKEKISKQILDWNFSKEKFLNVISPPYNSTEIFMGIILYFVNNNKRVLYVTNEDSLYIDILYRIKEVSKFRRYSYFRENGDYGSALLVVSQYERLKKLKDKFDLVIYDDINSFPMYSKNEIIKGLKTMCASDGKVISFSIEKIFENKREIILPVRENCYPIIEPKFIGTRIDMNKDIPYVVYEYFKWSVNIKHKVIVYVPDEEKIINVYKYLYKYCSRLNKNIFTFIKKKNDDKMFLNFIRMKKGIIITNDFKDLYANFNNINIMVFFANDKLFDYKKLVYFCGKVGRSERRHKGEVIFLGNSETEDIDITKNITRHFNKEAWEMELLKV
ncbi:hypothetical protein OW763_15020 [Clostridium aestuarii]|uniref:Uncharacterized protein n=1 Tax=Clostridium aestuarii TaxID=338193 RepID=A0ABT4D331_9CLOT|nr:hypothetical protein [Clostridium aestuarii]MCY6485641.1 hypothetical protein [Clostridium aestuarii]